MTEKKTDPFRYINSILENKKDLSVDPEFEKEYDPFLTNRALSLHIDSILYANELNQYPSLPSKMQYDYYLHAIRKMRRKFAKWPKKPKDETVGRLMQYYQINRAKAEEYAQILSKEQLNEIYNDMKVGG